MLPLSVSLPAELSMKSGIQMSRNNENKAPSAIQLFRFRANLAVKLDDTLH